MKIEKYTSKRKWNTFWSGKSFRTGCYKVLQSLFNNLRLYALKWIEIIVLKSANDWCRIRKSLWHGNKLSSYDWKYYFRALYQWQGEFWAQHSGPPSNLQYHQATIHSSLYILHRKWRNWIAVEINDWSDNRQKKKNKLTYLSSQQMQIAPSYHWDPSKFRRTWPAVFHSNWYEQLTSRS